MSSTRNCGQGTGGSRQGEGRGRHRQGGRAAPGVEHPGAENPNRPMHRAVGAAKEGVVSVSSSRNGRAEKPGQWENCASPAARLVWRGYEWAAGVEDRSLCVDRRSAAEQQKIVDRRHVDHESCVYLSLLAFHRHGENDEFFDVQWRAVQQAELGGLLGMYSRSVRKAVRVYTMSASGELQPEFTVGAANPGMRCILVLPAGGGTLHCLPLGKLSVGAKVVVPALIRAELVEPPVVAETPSGGPPEEEPEYDLVELPPGPTVAAHPRVTVDGPIGPTAVDGATADLAEVAEAEYTRLLVEYRSTKTQESRSSTTSVHKLLADGDLSDATADGNPCVSYRGIQPPPPTIHDEHGQRQLCDVDWRGGWFPSQCPERPSLLRQQLLNAVSDVDYASATLDNFERFGTRTAYLEVRFEGGLHLAGRRTVTDGQMSVEFFTAGDTLHLRGASWCVRRVSSGALRVVPTCVTAGIRGRQPFSRFRRGVRVQAAVKGLDATSRAKALWQVVCLSNENATETAILNRMRGDEAKNEYKGVDAESSADLVRVLASRYRSAGNVAGPYAWGHCYSCGGPLQGKMKQRICCPGKNGQLARYVAEGLKVTSHAEPVRYPGVVHTRSRHPPLKDGVETIATKANFHMPRRGLRLCRPPPSVTVRDSGVSDSTGRFPL